MTENKEKTTSKKDEKIYIDKSKIDALINKVEDQGKRIEMLTSVADKARIHKFEQANKDFSEKSIMVNSYKNKIIVAWKMMSNEVYQDAKSQWHEKQDIALVYEDGTKDVISYMDFTRSTKQIKAILEKRYSTEDGHNMMRLALGDKIIKIDERFVN